MLVEPKKEIFFNARKSANVGTYNCRTLKAKWRRHELVCYCTNKNIEVLAIQEHRIIFQSEDPIRKEKYENDWYFIYTSADEHGGGGGRVFNFISNIQIHQ